MENSTRLDPRVAYAKMQPKYQYATLVSGHAEKDQFASYFAWNAWQMFKENYIYYGGLANIETSQALALKKAVSFLQLKGALWSCLNWSLSKGNMKA